MTDVVEVVTVTDTEGNPVDVNVTAHETRYAPDPVQALVDEVLHRGHRVPSRYGDTIELLGGRLSLSANALVDRPGINRTLGWMEMLQLVAGVYDLGQLKRIAPKSDHSLFTYPMAYGPRVSGVIEDVVHALKTDPNSRQAVVFVGKPQDGISSDLPCTLTIQFLQRRRHLHAIVSMRSWDLCRGLPYDMMMFCGWTQLVARCLDVRPGNVIVHAGSAHIYEGWLDRLPYLSSSAFRLNGAVVPKEWSTMPLWAAAEFQNMAKGGQPVGVTIYGPDGNPVE